MLAVIVNMLAVLAGGTVGLLLKKGFPEKISRAVMLGIALCTLYIGISGCLQTNNVLVMILSMVFGAIVGTLLNIDGAITRLGDSISDRVRKKSGRSSLTEGFVTSSLLFCVGAMTLVGSLNAGLRGDYEMLFTKSLLDMISSCMLAVSLGAGVLLSAAFILVFQGGIVLLAQVLAPILTQAAIAEITAVGSLLIIATGLNMLGITKLKTADYLPALLFAPLFNRLCELLPI